MINKLILVIALLFPAINVNSQCACCSGAASGAAFGDINNGILTLKKNQFSVEGYGDFRSMNKGGENHSSGTMPVMDPGTDAEHANDDVLLDHMLITSAGVRYGVSNSFMVSALLPYSFLYTQEGNDDGLGDLVLTGTYSVFSKSAFNIAVIGGVELPTGVQKDASFDNTTVVLGSGSYDPLAGLAFSKRWNKIVLYGNGLFKYTTTGFEGNNYGNLCVQNLSVGYTLIGEGGLCGSDTVQIKEKSPVSWSVSTGYYGEWLDQIYEDGETDPNSGYYLGYATVGTKVSINTWSIPVTVSLPVIQQMNGDQHNAGSRIRVGIVKIF